MRYLAIKSGLYPWSRAYKDQPTIFICLIEKICPEARASQKNPTDLSYRGVGEKGKSTSVYSFCFSFFQSFVCIARRKGIGNMGVWRLEFEGWSLKRRAGRWPCTKIAVAASVSKRQQWQIVVYIPLVSFFLLTCLDTCLFFVFSLIFALRRKKKLSISKRSEFARIGVGCFGQGGVEESDPVRSDTPAFSFTFSCLFHHHVLVSGSLDVNDISILYQASCEAQIISLSSRAHLIVCLLFLFGRAKRM